MPPQAPSFGQTVANTFAGSTEALGSCVQGLVLAGVALVPWLPLLLLPVVGIWLLVRWGSRPRPASPAN